MKRIFSGAKSPKLSAPPNVFKSKDSPSAPGSPKVDQGLRNLTVSASRFFSSSSSSPGSPTLNLPQEHSINGDISPELVPIVTLLSAQAHRRYHYGILLILHDLKTDGTPAARQWEECYGVLLGTQLALWDAKELSSSKTNKEDSNLKKIASRPTFINFTDASVRILDANDDVTSTGDNRSNTSDLDNVLVVSTTLKNRYFLKFRNSESFKIWDAAIRLSLFEFTALQEAYTGSFLSSRGVKLGDIKVVMADTKFTYEDWVSVRFGTGMPWKRCYAVISPQPNKKKKNSKGSICFYENDKKTKKSNAMTTVVDAKALYAVYPSSPILIDTSTIIKLEGLVSFEKHEEPQETNIFIMPEKHQGVPGYDTIIRFLIPAMNAFYLYGRPKGLIANRVDPDSLLFALPTLPHIHYLQVDDVLSLTKDKNYLHWNAADWRNNIVQLLQKKLSKGYKGCGTKSVPIASAMAKSPAISSVELFDGYDSLPASQLESLQNSNTKTRSTLALADDANSFSISINSRAVSANQILLSVPDNSSRISDPLSTQSSAITNFKDSFTTPMTSGMLNKENMNRSLASGMKVEITDSSLKSMGEVEPDSSNNFSTTPEEKHIPLANAAELSALYDKYSTSPFGKTEANLSPKPQPLDVNDRIESETRSPYERYVGTSAESKIFEIGNVRESKSTINTCLSSPIRVEDNRLSKYEDLGSLREFEELSQKISNMGVGNVSSEALNERSEDNSLVTDLNLDISTDSPSTLPDDQRELDFGEANVFDPDYMEQNQMLETESRYTTDEFDFSDNQDAGSSNYSSTQVNPTPTEKLPVSGRNEKIPHSSLFTNLNQLTSNGGTYQNQVNATEYQMKQPQQSRVPHTGLQSPSYADRNLQTNNPQPPASYSLGRPLANIRTGPLTNQPMHQGGNSPINSQFPQQRFAPSQQPQQAQLFPMRNNAYRGINNQHPLYPSQQQPQNVRYPNNKAPMNSRGPVPTIQPHIQDDRSIPPVMVNNHTKPRVAQSGFSQFMPHNNTSTNPYSN